MFSSPNLSQNDKIIIIIIIINKKNQFGVEIKRFRSDNARDNFNQILSSYFQKEDIIHESSSISTSQQSGVAERKMTII